MRPHLATLLDDFRRFGREKAIVRHVGIRRKVTSYEEMAKLAGRFAALLAQRGIGPGDRVLLWAENSAEWIAAFYGCLLRGVLTVPLDVYGTPEFAVRVAHDVHPALIVGDAALLRTLQGEWPKHFFEDWPSALPAEEARPEANLSHNTPLQILFTSGTTGEPKGIVQTHGNVLASLEPIEHAARGYLRYERLVHPLRFLHTLPLSHTFGQMMGLWIPPIFSAEVHFERRLNASRLVDTIHRERISVLAAVPRILAVLKSYLEMAYPNLPKRLAAAQNVSAAERWWRFRDIHAAFGIKFWAFITGGGALPSPIEQFWNSLGFVLVQGYGMTETSALITLNHPFRVARGTIGKPLPGREVRLQPDGEVLVRGPMISPATWSGGSLHPRTEEWLATGDLVEAQPTGELRFLGRKSEVIVTGTGVNIHPEDFEAALEQEPTVAACAVVPVKTPIGSEPCAVLALRGEPQQATAILQRANARMGESHRIRRWALWPEPDLPRTSTGKVKRAAITDWLSAKEISGEGTNSDASADWLLSLIARITGESSPSEHQAFNSNHDLLLAEDLHLDSLGRVQLLDALEERLGVALDPEKYNEVRTLGGLRQFVTHPRGPATEISQTIVQSDHPQNLSDSLPTVDTHGANTHHQPEVKSSVLARYIYPRWPWLRPFRWMRAVFVEGVVRPLVWLLAKPRVIRMSRAPAPDANDTMLIIANHVTAYDVALLLFALPRAVRSRTAVAMSGEMLEDFRHARNAQLRWLDPLGPLAWLLITALFNVFPLPRQRDLQRSFAHIGQALDRGYHVIVFPEGTRSPDGSLAAFRPGIGLLVKESSAPILPMALHGLGELKTRKRRWFRSGILEVRVGQSLRFDANESEAAITTRLFAEVENLLTR
jgi:long-chain acyl-CoA synthetase